MDFDSGDNSEQIPRLNSLSPLTLLQDSSRDQGVKDLPNLTPAEIVDTNFEESLEPEIIGEYRQLVATILSDNNQNVYVVQPGIYRVVAQISTDRKRVIDPGIVFQGTDEALGLQKNLVRFHGVQDIRELAQAGTLKLDPSAQSLLAHDVDRKTSLEQPETRRMGMRR